MLKLIDVIGQSVRKSSTKINLANITTSKYSEQDLEVLAHEASKVNWLLRRKHLQNMMKTLRDVPMKQITISNRHDLHVKVFITPKKQYNNWHFAVGDKKVAISDSRFAKYGIAELEDIVASTVHKKLTSSRKRNKK